MALESLSSHFALSLMASQFCFTTLSVDGAGLLLKNASTSTAFSSVTNPDVATYNAQVCGSEMHECTNSYLTWMCCDKPL